MDNAWFLLIVLAIVMVITGPLVTIWSINLLFGLAIEYSLSTWAAVAWLGALVSGSLGAAYKKTK
jgi:hypothetical protein